MIEIEVRSFFEDSLKIPVYMEFPSEKITRFVVLRKANTDRENLIDGAQFVAESYEESLFKAAELNELVKAKADELTELDTVVAVERGGDYPAFDHTNKRYRYQAIFNITHY